MCSHAAARNIITAEACQAEDLPPSAYTGVVYAVRQLASDALDHEPEPDLVKLGEELRVWISDLLRQR
jgi:hypothetical protein